MVRVDLSSFSLQNGTEMKVEQTDYICIKNVDVLTETCCRVLTIPTVLVLMSASDAGEDVKAGVAG